MSTLFNQALSALQGFFSKTFWFGAFLPVAIFAAANLGIGALAFPGSNWLPIWLGSGGEWAVYIPYTVAALIVAAYALTPMIPMFRGMLDGTRLPLWLHDRLYRQRLKEVHLLRDGLQAALRQQSEYPQLIEAATERIWSARRTGAALAAPGGAGIPALGPATEAIERAVGRVEALRRAADRRYLAPTETGPAIDAVVTALEGYPANLPGAHPNTAQLDWSKRLAGAQEVLLGVLRDSDREAAYRYRLLVQRTSSAVSLYDPQATAVGDARILAQRYTQDVYAADFAFLWPRLQLVLPKEDAVTDRVLAAEAQINFAVLSTVLMTVVPVVWLPVLAIADSTPWVFLGLAGVAPLVVAFFYRMTIESQVVFGETVKTAIDRYRFDLLKDLRQPMPASLEAERDLWRRLDVAGGPERLSDLVYRHPT